MFVLIFSLQAGDRIRGFTPDQRARFIENIEMWMTEPKTTDEVGQQSAAGRPSSFCHICFIHLVGM